MHEKKILIVEDDQPIADLLAYRLGKEGYAVETAPTGALALQKAADNPPDLLLLDWMLPDISGLEVCQQITQTQRIPIIMITARNLVEDKILGLEAGADDYITKPFDMREVVARLKATFRRMESQAAQTPPDDAQTIAFGDIVIDPKGMSVTKGGQNMDLTHLEYSLLLYFYENRNQVLTRDQILDSVWGYSYFGNTRTVDIHVLRLRRKLGLDQQIQTVFKVGYKFTI
ncbi:MAG: response regulator transcription factor [Eubacteriales bacterium]|nr:response regulator transcription factor [Eubacteriales bacterium]